MNEATLKLNIAIFLEAMRTNNKDPRVTEVLKRMSLRGYGPEFTLRKLHMMKY